MLTRKVPLLVMIAVFLAGVALGSEAIPNWPAPATWTPSRAVGAHTLTDITNPLPFIGVSPCRVADTRGNGFTGAYGPPSIGANTQRVFTIKGQCGIPDSALAVSFNFGALNVGGTGDLRVFPFGGSVPVVSTLNYNANTPNIANAAIVPLGSGSIKVQADAVPIDLIIDVNGYFVRIDLEEILVKASRNVEFFYTVNGVRRTHRDLKPIGPGSEFMPRGADARVPAYLTEGQKALLVSNGTYNADGSVNMETAGRLGWTRVWADREAPARTLATADAAVEVATSAGRR